MCGRNSNNMANSADLHGSGRRSVRILTLPAKHYQGNW